MSVRAIAQRLSGFRPANSRIVKRYLSSANPRKLHLGCGPHPLNGWLNTDLFCRHGVVYVDVTGRFPFPDEVFDYVYSEHTIEHLPYLGGLNMLLESFRVLKPRGKVRFATPDFAFLKGLHNSEKSDLQKAYLSWSLENWVKSGPVPHPEMFVINNFVRSWGHQFIYDEATLTDAIRQAGFTGIQRCALNASEDAALSSLENESRMPAGFLKLESLVLEAAKPSARA